MFHALSFVSKVKPFPTCFVTSRIHFDQKITCKIVQYGPSVPWTCPRPAFKRASDKSFFLFAQEVSFHSKERRVWHVRTTILHEESGRTARIHGPSGEAARAVDAAVLPSSLCRIVYIRWLCPVHCQTATEQRTTNCLF